MKRIAQIHPRWGLALVGLLAGGKVVAQGVPGAGTTDIGNRAQVYAVAGTGKAAPFRVPQVRLPNATVARCINRELRRRLLAANVDEADSTAPLLCQLQQASRACCYDATLRQWNRWEGLTGCDYEVVLNQGGLLSLAYFEEFTGAYSWERTSHVTFDLRTGRVLALTDLLADDPAQLQRRLQGAINRRLTETLRETDPADSAEVAERFREDRAGRAAGLAAGEDAVSLADFALTPSQVLVFYRVSFPHVVMNLEPNDTYTFPLGRLHPRGLLLPLAKKAKQARRR